MVAVLKLNVNLHLSFRYQAGLLGTYFPRHVVAGVLPGEKKSTMCTDLCLFFYVGKVRMYVFSLMMVLWAR